MKLFIFFVFNLSYLSAIGQKLTAPSFSSLPYAAPFPFKENNNLDIQNIIKPLIINSPLLQTLEGSDIVIVDGTVFSESENSVFIHPENSSRILNANNTISYNGLVSGVGEFTSNSSGQIWSERMLLDTSFADPAVTISKSTGRYFVNFINNDNGQSIAYSDDFGSSWSYVTVASNPDNSLLDKNHLWVDNSEYRLDGSSNPYYGNLYIAWVQLELGGDNCTHTSSNDYQIMLTRSTNNGENWSTPLNISAGTNSICHNQGVNIQTGPNGTVYACWSIYDVWPDDEVAIGFNKSSNGGVSWDSATRIQNITGHRNTDLGGGKSMRHNSFPSMTVNQQNGQIYIAWTNRGEPEGSLTDPDIYMIKSSDEGDNWNSPVRVNQDAVDNGKDQWFPWIACDEVTGALVVTYYDSRDFVNNDSANTYISISYNEGNTWKDYLISDIAWSGDAFLDNGYAGDYIGIDISNGFIVPVWSDDRNGILLAYTQPFIIPCLGDDLMLCNDTISDRIDYRFYNTITVGGSGCNFLITDTGKSDMQANMEIVYKDGVKIKGELHAQIVSHCNDTEFDFAFAKTSPNVIDKPDFSANSLNERFQCKIYPNPSRNGMFQLETRSESNHTIKIQLVNMLGKTVYKLAIPTNNNQTIDISSFPKGVYLAMVQNEGRLFTYKVMYQ